MATPLSKAFPTLGEEPREIVQSFDFSKIDPKNPSTLDSLHIELAPSFGTAGKLTKQLAESLNDDTKIMLASLVRSIETLPQGKRDWDSLHATLMQNPLLEVDPDQVMRTDTLVKEGKSAFKFDGSPDAAIVKEVEQWYYRLIGDDDVIRTTGIDINVLAKIVAQTGATVVDLESLIHKEERHEKQLADVAILEFPQPDRPYIKVYRIKLKAWSVSRRLLLVQEDSNGITGDYNSRIYRPRQSIINVLSPEVREKAIELFEKMVEE